MLRRHLVVTRHTLYAQNDPLGSVDDWFYWFHSWFYGQHMMKTVFKTIQFEKMPKYVRGFFQMRNTERNLRGSRKLVIPYVNTTAYGLHSFRYTAANMWNKLTEDLRSLTSLNELKTKICQISFEHQCNCYLCK